jgi:hypothetical protein
MTRTQIQLPDPLYRQLKRIAEEQDWSLAEVLRRAGELYAQRYPEREGTSNPWKLPDAVDLGEAKVPVDRLRQEADAIIERGTIR